MADLLEYRCSCGKLLFKGVMLLSLIEIKCDRCHTVQTIRQITPNLIGQSSFVILIDVNGKIVNVSNSILKLLGYSWSELAKLDLFTLCPILTPLFVQKLWNTCYMVPVSMRTAVFFRAKGTSPQRVTLEFKFLELHGVWYMFAIVDTACRPVCGADGKVLPYIMGPHPHIMYFELDYRNCVVDSECINMGLLGYTRRDLAKIPVWTLWPAYQTYRASLKTKKSFEILDNILVAKNKKPVTVETYFLSNLKPTRTSSERWWVYSFVR